MTAIDERALAQEREQAAQDEDIWIDLMPHAAELVILSGLGSARMLQRKMRIGWTLADELLFELHELGVVGEDVDGARQVLVDGDGLADVLARIATLAAGDDPGDDTTPPVVNLVKTSPPPATWGGGEAGDDEAGEPGAELAIRPYDGLVVARTARQVQTLVVRARQATARQAVWVADQPVVSRTLVVGRQLPVAGARLATCTPRGAKRLTVMLADWLRDAQSANLLAKHSEAGEGESYAKVAQARQQIDLAARRWVVGVAALAVVLLGLAWWAPQAFAGVLASAALAIGVSVAPRNHLREWLLGLAFSAGLAWLVWCKGADLATLIPQPPSWVWLAVGLVVLVVLGLVGRQEDRPILQVPTAMTSHKPPPITAPMIVEALFRIGVAGMTMSAADKGMRDEIRVRAPGVGRAKHGWQIELELPPGITAGDVGERREELAGALRRPLGCVWPSGGGDHPGHLRIYIGDKPMATAQQSEWPLAAGHPIDLFAPFPLFTDEEGRWVDVTLLGTHAVVAGASGFGKSVTLRQLAVACALDPRAQIHVFDGKISGDLGPLQKVAHSYHEGAEPEDIADQLLALQAIETEMRRRARFLRNLPLEERSPKVTSALASKYTHLSPIALLVDEVQEYTEYGVKGSKEDKAIREAFVATFTRISRLGRSAGIAMVLVSQKPEASVIPTAIMGNCAIRVCHKVTEQGHNDQVLGTSAYKNGYNAALFSQEDRGLAWLRAEGDPQVVRSWSAMVELDPAIELVDKAYALRKTRGLLTGQAAGDDGIEDAEIVISIAEDTLQVMRQHGNTTTAHLDELVGWLQEMRPLNYDSLDVKELGKRLRNDRMKVTPVWRADRTKQGIDLRKQPPLGES